MARISIAAERLLEVCHKATAEAEKRRGVENSSRAFTRTTFHGMEPQNLDTAHTTARGLKSAAQRAIELAGPGQAHIVLNSQEIDELEWLKGFDK